MTDVVARTTNILSLCTGYAGIELGLRLALRDPRTVCYAEREAYVIGVLRARMLDGLLDDAPIWSDLRSFDGRPWCGVVDIVTAGAPCQPFSTASRGRKVAEDLLPAVVRIVEEIGAPFFFAENVPASRDAMRGLGRILKSIGYRVEGPAELSAAALGAAHQRPRLWLFAYADSQGERLSTLYGEVASLRKVAGYVPWRDGPTDAILGVSDGGANRMDRARALGNGVVPAMAARAFAELVSRAHGS